MIRTATLAVLLMGTPALACPVEPMQRARSAPEAAAAYRLVTEAGAACSAEQAGWAARLAALRHYQAAAALARSQRPVGEVIAALDAALRFAPLWQAYALRGDLRQRQRDARGRVDFAAASLDYQHALNDIEAGDPRSDPVSNDVIATIFRKAEQTRLLAEQPVDTPPTRSGAPGGLAARQIRSFAPVAVAMPIQFVFGTADPTPGGLRAAEQLGSMLDAEGRPSISLVGHTDPTGDAELNRILSVRRAEAVRALLVRRGYDPARIRVSGRGSDAPLRIEAADGYTRDQVHQILRRVELVRRMIPRRDLLAAAGAVALPGLLHGRPAAAQPAAPAVHALLVGINAYRFEPLSGCLNDLRIMDAAIRPRAATVTTLADREATRTALLRTWESVTARCQPGDWFFFSFSGHGDRMREAIRGSEEDGMDDFLVLAPFHPREAPREILLDNELEQMLAALGRRGITVVFVADCCHAGTMTRSVHPAARRQQRFRTTQGTYPVDDLADALASAPPPPPAPPPGSLSHVHLLAGSVETLPVPEVEYQGRPHGALSVAVSRLLAQPGQPRLRDLADQVVRGVRALGDGRQHAQVTLGADPDRPIFGPRAAPASAARPPDPQQARPGPTQVAVTPVQGPPPQQVAPPTPAPLPTPPVTVRPPPPADVPVRLRVDGRPDAAAQAAIAALQGVERVGEGGTADLIWHAATRQTVSALGDILAYDVAADMLAASVARVRAVRRLQALAVENAAELLVERIGVVTRGLSRTAILQVNNAAHPAGATLKLTASRLQQTGFVLFGLAGNGAVQMLYPGTDEPPRIQAGRPFVVDDIYVKPPFGADHVVAVAMAADTGGLVRRLNALHEKREPLAAVAAVEEALRTGPWQLGLLGIFTRPA